jgi:plasmid stabilization system protein ParE
MMKIFWSPRAHQDLHQIADLIAQDKPRAALQWAQKVYKKVSRLKKFPHSGRVVAERGRQDLREIIVGNYRVIYKIIGKSIYILTVFHGAKKLRGRL